MPTITVFLVIIAVLCLLPTQVAAFGAGNIPSIAYLEDKAFRHGDIEDIIATIILSKTFILSKKFSSLDVKRIYFGNWLRDYSQAIDVATLSRGLPLENLVLLVSVLGFMAHGYATEEFEVTKERLGCYRAEEHIDNPKGYCENDDARRYDQRLRPPVNPMECAIDPQTGMKNYIKNEAGGWPTSSAYVRDQLTKCVSFGKAGDMNEAFRHLGAALHTLEDFSAHSNYCELALLELGYTHVFPFVGDATMVNVMGKRVYPLVTGTFGSTDFVHSLLGEATDHASSISITSLSNQMETARSRSTSGDADINTLVNLLSQAPGMGDLAKEIQSVDQRTRSGPANDQDLKGQIWSLLCLRDKIVKSISQTMEKIPGLNWLAEKITESVQVFILTKLEPLLRPLLSSTTSSLQSLSSTIIASESQQQIFTDPHCSDPTHSQLSKDHFDLFLNEPAGKIAKVVVRHIVEAVVDAWKSGETRQVLGLAMEVMHHPCHVSTALQREMMEVMRVWARENDAKVRMLGKDAVKEHRNRENVGAGNSGCGGGAVTIGRNPGGYSQGTQGQGYGQNSASQSGFVTGGVEEVRMPSAGGGYGAHPPTHDHASPYGYNQPQSMPGFPSPQHGHGHGHGPGSGGYPPIVHQRQDASGYPGSYGGSGAHMPEPSAGPQFGGYPQQQAQFGQQVPRTPYGQPSSVHMPNPPHGPGSGYPGQHGSRGL